MEHNMILSASGWRKVFAADGDEESRAANIGHENTLLSALIAESFAEYMATETGKTPVIAVGRDTRPTGKAIADAVLRVLCGAGVNVKYLDVTAAPEIFCYARHLDGFLYISASHNPIGHNGIKFGANEGGVLAGSENAKIIDAFIKKCSHAEAETYAEALLSRADAAALSAIYADAAENKAAALSEYSSFMKTVITGTGNHAEQEETLGAMKKTLSAAKLGIIADMNGSARTKSIDRAFIQSLGIQFFSFNDEAGSIAHAIIPEPENLVHTADAMRRLHEDGKSEFLLGYMPDCDGDRGNIVYWDEKTARARAIAAQEVFALCVLSELAFSYRQNGGAGRKRGVAINCPTSMRVNDIAAAFEAEVFRAEVGEANVVNLARKKRAEGFEVRILGEGSNGGNITDPSNVRDPLATIFALVKLLTIRDSEGKKGLFRLWCEKSGQEDRYKDDFTLSDVIASLPAYATTGVSEERAVLNVRSEDKGALKSRFQSIFEREWQNKRASLLQNYGIASYEADATNGTEEILGAADWNNGNGGLKVRFFTADGTPAAFIWMRPSGTENVFRVLCDVKGSAPDAEKALLDWERAMLIDADGRG
ncbi:MAG: phosphoglucomutase [Treponema sp.]